MSNPWRVPLTPLNAAGAQVTVYESAADGPVRPLAASPYAQGPGPGWTRPERRRPLQGLSERRRPRRRRPHRRRSHRLPLAAYPLRKHRSGRSESLPHRPHGDVLLSYRPASGPCARCRLDCTDFAEVLIEGADFGGSTGTVGRTSTVIVDDSSSAVDAVQALNAVGAHVSGFSPTRRPEEGR
jgi:hypothetical protein